MVSRSTGHRLSAKLQGGGRRRGANRSRAATAITCHKATSTVAYRRLPLLSGGKALEGRGFVPADHVPEQLGERDRRVVFVERAHYLRANWESSSRTPYGRGHGRQARQ
jgi:hypothetical protein